MLIGFLLAPILLALFPSRERILAKGESIQTAKFVTPPPQLVAIIIDYLLIKFSWIFTLGFFITDDFIKFIYTTIGFFVIFFLVPLTWNGKTIGTGIMRFKLSRTRDRQLFWKSLLKRTVALYLPVMMTDLLMMFAKIEVAMDSFFYPYHVWASIAIIIFLVIMWMTLFIHVVFIVMKKGQRNYYFDFVADLIPEKK